MSQPEIGITIYQGLDSEPLIIRVQDASGDPVALGGFSARGQIRLYSGQPLLQDLPAHITADDDTGEIHIPHIPAAITAEMPTGIYRYDLILTYPDGITLPQPLILGRVIVRPKITL